MSIHDNLLREVEGFARFATDGRALMQRVADRIHIAIARYNCVKFFLVDKSNDRVLVLGPYTGSFDPVPRIMFEQGLCGAAASSGKTIVVNSVAADPRYLAASDLVKSEIVVPILVAGKVVGEISVESYFSDTFTEPDCKFIEACGRIVAMFLEENPLN